MLSTAQLFLPCFLLGPPRALGGGNLGPSLSRHLAPAMNNPSLSRSRNGRADHSRELLFELLDSLFDGHGSFELCNRQSCQNVIHA